MERFFIYFSIKFDNLYLKWNFLRIWLWKWKKWILFYERSPSKIILIENTKLFFFFVVVVVCVCVYIYIYIYNLSNKKCVYIIKKRAYVYIYVCGSCLDKYISITLDPPNKNSWLRSCPSNWRWHLEKTLKYIRGALRSWNRLSSSIHTWE